MSTLKLQYEKACNEYVKIFCKKQDMEFELWICDTIGDIAMCNDFFFSLSDIAYDVNSNQPKGLIIDWYYENIEAPNKSINYYSYTNGLRVAEIK